MPTLLGQRREGGRSNKLEELGTGKAENLESGWEFGFGERWEEKPAGWAEGRRETGTASV